MNTKFLKSDKKIFFQLIIIVIFLISFMLKNSFGQDNPVNIKKDGRIEELISKHIEYNKELNSISGFRVQIFFGSGNFSRTNAMKGRSDFMEKYRDIDVYVVFQSPNYVVRVGNFRTRLEAEALKQKILPDYPEAYIVKDDIELPGIK